MHADLEPLGHGRDLTGRRVDPRKPPLAGLDDEQGAVDVHGHSLGEAEAPTVYCGVGRIAPSATSSQTIPVAQWATQRSSSVPASPVGTKRRLAAAH